MQPLGAKVYLLKRYSPSDSFWTFFSVYTFRYKKQNNKHASMADILNIGEYILYYQWSLNINDL